MSAFGVASGVTQFIGFTIQLLQLCSSFHNVHGELPPDLARIETLIADFQSLMQRVETQLSQDTSLEEPTFKSLIDQCLIEIRGIFDILGKLKAPAGRLDPLNLRNAYQALRSSDKIAKSEATLQQYRIAVSARLALSTQEKQQYICDMLDRSKFEARQSSRAVNDAMALLKSSIANSSRAISTDVSALLVYNEESKAALGQLLHDIKQLDAHVQILETKLSEPLRSSRTQPGSILQLQSVRRRTWPRVKRRKDIKSLASPRSLAPGNKAEADVDSISENETSAKIQLSISLKIDSNPHDVVSLLRKLLFSSWKYIVEPINALASQGSSMLASLLHNEEDMQYFYHTINEQPGRFLAVFDATTGIFSTWNESCDVLLTMRFKQAAQAKDNSYTNNDFRLCLGSNMSKVQLPLVSSVSLELTTLIEPFNYHLFTGDQRLVKLAETNSPHPKLETNMATNDLAILPAQNVTLDMVDRSIVLQPLALAMTLPLLNMKVPTFNVEGNHDEEHFSTPKKVPLRPQQRRRRHRDTHVKMSIALTAIAAVSLIVALYIEALNCHVDEPKVYRYSSGIRFQRDAEMMYGGMEYSVNKCHGSLWMFFLDSVSELLQQGDTERTMEKSNDLERWLMNIFLNNMKTYMDFSKQELLTIPDKYTRTSG